MNIISDDFLLESETARQLYHGYAKQMGIFDYHCHLSPQDIALDRKFANLTEIWLAGDHYKWRLMRANGVEDRYITGDAPDEEKFLAWAATIAKSLRNPVYHWSYLELDRYFGIRDTLLNSRTARSVYDRCGNLLQRDDFSVRNLIKKMNVKILCTTDDPTDDLRYHEQIRESGFGVKVLPAFRPDRGMAVESALFFNDWVSRLEEASDREIRHYDEYISAIKMRHDHFHEAGCRISDHGLETPYADDYTEREIRDIFSKLRSGKNLDAEERGKFKSAMMLEFASMDARKGWTHQLHFGALRGVNSRMRKILGPDTGYDSMGDFEIARPLAKFLDKLDALDCLPKMILYNIHPKDNEVLATMAGSFQDGCSAGKMQFGPAWWFLDQKDGMTRQINALSNVGLLSRFVGMVTDSRSFLSYPRHEYFRRILCNIIGAEVEKGEIFEDIDTLGGMVRDICFHNAQQYFGIEVQG
ncbi:MAG: glucuronate isomerase [Smithellaceae bacterium]|nr:glucuronate isomerase [Smithellaceae bacterium]